MSPKACLAVVRSILPREPELAPVAQLLERLATRDKLAAARQSRYRERKKIPGVYNPPEAGFAVAGQPRAAEEGPRPLGDHAGVRTIPANPPPLPPEQQPLSLATPKAKAKLPPGRKRLPSDPNDTEFASVELVLSKLSANCGRSYEARSPKGAYSKHCRLLVRLLRDGYTEHDLRIVVWERSILWAKDPRMNAFLRPKTLFGPDNFQEYLPHARTAWGLFELERDRTGQEPRGAALRALVEVAEGEEREYGDGYEEGD